MQTGNNDMDKKLRQLENQSLPDLSKQDKHWQQFQTMLQPGTTPAAKGNGWFKKPWHWIVAASFIAGIFAASYWLKRPVRDTTIVNQPPALSAKDTVVVTTSIKDSVPDGTAMKIRSNQDGPPVHNGQAVTKKPAGKRVISKKDTVIIPALDTEALTNTENNAVKPEEAATLAGFFQQLEKETQEFVIDSKKDEVITGKDGTVLLVPANTFAADGKVTILLKEYYSYEDIITNKLSTSSNGRQLVTGGMIHLSAMKDGKEVQLRSAGNIRWFVPDTSTAMKTMQVFEGRVTDNKQSLFGVAELNDGFGTGGTLNVFSEMENINWIPQQLFFENNYLTTMVKVLDMRNQPYKSHYTKKGEVGKFHIASDSRISKEDMEDSLKKKFGYYKVKIKYAKKDRLVRPWGFLSFLKRTNRWKSSESLGDSAWIDAVTARRYRLQATDTVVTRGGAFWLNANGGVRPKAIGVTSERNKQFDVFTTKLGAGRLINDTTANGTPEGSAGFSTALASRFSVDVNTLGWINCDRFYNDGRPKVPLYVDLKDTAANYYTLLVFDRIKSMMTGSVAGNRVLFQNIPEGETARVISVGIKKGKPVVAMENVKINRTTLTGLKFEETTPAAFKEQAAAMDN